MSSFIKRYKAKNGGTVIQVVFKRGRAVERTVHIGTAHTEEHLQALLSLAQDTIHKGQLRLGLFEDESLSLGLVLESTYSRLLWEALSGVYDKLGFDALGDDIFKQLVLCRIIEPASKADTIRIIDSLGLPTPSYSGICRTLRRVLDDSYRDILSGLCFRAASPDSLSLALYDVTTLYFEIQKEDGYRMSGLSKERRLEPQITLGLLVDRNGFPLEIQSFEGNKAETKTIVPVLRSFAERHGLMDITVVADAAMLSGVNLTELEDMGYHYIVGSRLSKTPYEITEYLGEPGRELFDNQIFDTTVKVAIAGKMQPRRVIYQYKAKRGAIDLMNIEKAIAKAQRMINGDVEFKRNRFLKVTGAKREINHPLVEEAKRKAGIKGYVTNLDAPALNVIDAYHQLFQVEKTFRMSKSDLKARPIFHRLRDSIEAHLTVVFAALAIIRIIESVCGVSTKRFINTLEPLRTGVISLNTKRWVVEPRLEVKAKELIQRLDDWKCGS
jgi:hypothetical protein